MAKFVEFPLEGGGSIVIESPDEPGRSPSGFLRAGDGPALNADKSQATFDASVEAVRRSADLLVTKLRQLGEKPDELEISFNLKASAELGSLVVGKSGSEANFGVLLRWRSEQGDKERGKESSKEAGSPGEADEHYKSRKRRTLPKAEAVEVEQPETDDDDV